MSDDSFEDVTKQSEPLEALAHRLWSHWSMHIAEEEDISDERLQRWEQNWVPYNDLDEETKDTDRQLVERFCQEMPDYDRDVETDADQGDSE